MEIKMNFFSLEFKEQGFKEPMVAIKLSLYD